MRRRASAWEVAREVPDPELPMLTLGDLGILRHVEETVTGGVIVAITPTYSGCPALEAIRDDVGTALRAAGYADVEVRTLLSPPWTTDWIGETGRRKLAEAGIAPPGAAPARAAGPVPLTLGPPRRRLRCPRCGSDATEELSRFGSTACKSLWRCGDCREPFEHVKEI
ncbi:1,2-phenylacetyl-CoA epoxidase subunit PaaD [Sphaerisporangium sp. TRM90804]|uniref:1,2-phenylacetyl-CoA epoxidase subunit PaaD n=1 Tax=Sphaerisporangium sp. TRM90804 TaxID=3031113 RepID=UPI00244684AA|nr:1,2-phenylacetyl-CoA epoxidase subunit PaaD [Sphaerisporangium sp. TRM90804]MDH2429133.1 phenylacetate-CoA oxygenase subunit PaaJ [Sphaerisporangium sp. TRM90804]